MRVPTKLMGSEMHDAAAYYDSDLLGSLSILNQLNLSKIGKYSELQVDEGDKSD